MTHVLVAVTEPQCAFYGIEAGGLQDADPAVMTGLCRCTGGISGRTAAGGH